MKDLRIGILGADGFIGSHLFHHFLKQGWKVLGLDQTAQRLGENQEDFWLGDYRDNALAKEFLAEVDVVFHLASLCTPSVYNKQAIAVMESNFLAPYEFAKLCAKENKWLVQFSTSEVYGKIQEDSQTEGLKENETDYVLGPLQNSRWSYACAKQMLERSVYALGQEKNLAFTIIRPFNFIGPGMDWIPGVDGEGTPRVLACFAEALLKGKPLPLVDGGSAKRAFTSIFDVAEAMEALLLSKAEVLGKAFNIGLPENEISIRDLALLMTKLWETELGGKLSSPALQEVASSTFYGEGYEDSPRRLPNVEAFAKATGWKGQRDLPSTLKETLSWYKENYPV